MVTDASQDGGEPPVPPTASEQARRRRRRTTIEWVVLIVVALLVAFVVRTFVLQVFSIPSESMVPTLEVGDRVLVNKLSYRLHDPGRGDVIVFDAPRVAREKGYEHLVKRLIGLPGETIEGRDGRIYINGKVLDEPYLPKGTESRTFGPEKVPSGRYFMLGDNRQNSQDSIVIGSIARDQLVGRAFFGIWPLDRLGFL